MTRAKVICKVVGEMAQVNWSQDEKPPIDAVLETLAEAYPDRALKIRVQPTIYDYETRTYKTWTELSWVLEMDDVDEARRMREGLQDFFVGFGTAEKQAGLLADLKKRAGRG